ncbi:MAG: hypothetical protein NT099_01825 [Candidatus Saganbacteria bacterium]|nr:hypothetical protein [Candidatus Saganbacteria bacterium]
MPLSTNSVISQVQLRFRENYVQAQKNPRISKRTLKAGGIADQALNYALGFSTQTQRLFFLHNPDQHPNAGTTAPISQIVTSLFQKVADEVTRTAAWAYTEAKAMLKQGVKTAYAETQEITFIGTRFLKEGSTLDQKLNRVLGFKDQLERLEFLQDRMQVKDALKIIGWLEKVDKGEISDPPRISNQTVFWTIAKKITQMQFDALLKKSLGQFQSFRLPVSPFTFSTPKFTPISEAAMLKDFRLPKVGLPALPKHLHGLPGKKD